jgi:Fe-S-cluster formation regulator IscX/YfhJ
MKMALSKRNTKPAADSQKEEATPATNHASFEGMDDAATVGTAEKSTSPAAANVNAPEIKEEATQQNALTTAPATSLVAAGPVKKFTAALEEFRNVIDPAGMEFNTFTRVTVGLDGFEDDQKRDLGKSLKMQLLSFNDRWVASPGSQEADATPHVRYSLDGKTIEGTGEDVMAYIKTLKEVEGYTDASLKQYMTIYGFLIATDGKEIDLEDRYVIALQVPPQSRARFTRLQIEAGLKAGMGTMKLSDTLICSQEKQQGKDKKFAVIGFAMAK